MFGNDGKERGAACVMALLLLSVCAILASAVLFAAKSELKDARHYAAESKVYFAAEGNADLFVKEMLAEKLSPNERFGADNEVLVSDERENGIRKRIYIKRDWHGFTVYSFADAADGANGLKIFKQSKFYMEFTGDGYAVKYKLP